MGKKRKYYFLITKRKYIFRWWVFSNSLVLASMLVFISIMFALRLNFLFFSLLLLALIFLVVKFFENFDIRSDYTYFQLRNIKFVDVASKDELPELIFDLKRYLAYNNNGYIQLINPVETVGYASGAYFFRVSKLYI